MTSKNDNNKGFNDSVFDWGSRQSFGDFLKSTSIGSGNSEVGKVFLHSMRLSSPHGEVVVGDDDRRRPHLPDVAGSEETHAAARS